MRRTNTKTNRFDPLLEDEIFRLKRELDSIFGKNVSLREASRVYAKMNQKQFIVVKESKSKKRDISKFLW